MRTIQRDIKFLSEKCFDIVRGKARGYHQLNKAADVHGQTLNLEEVLSLALGSSALTDTLGDKGQQAMQKLTHFIKDDKKLAVRDFSESLAFGQTDDVQRWMPDAMVAVSQRKTLRFRYHAPEATSDRTVDPYTLFYQGERWYLQGWDHDRRDLRNFRLTRIATLDVGPETFALPAGYNSKSALFHKWDLITGPPVSACFRVSDALGRWLRENPVHASQRLEGNVLTLEVRNLDALASWLMGLDGIEALSPPALRSLLKEKALRIAALYD